MACSYGRDENRWQNMGKKMWENLERYGKMKNWLERDTNGNDILKYQNMVKDEKVMPKYGKDGKRCQNTQL
jgi:hypothetical protein